MTIGRQQILTNRKTKEAYELINHGLKKINLYHYHDNNSSLFSLTPTKVSHLADKYEQVVEQCVSTLAKDFSEDDKSFLKAKLLKECIKQDSNIKKLITNEHINHLLKSLLNNDDKNQISMTSFVTNLAKCLISQSLTNYAPVLFLLLPIIPAAAQQLGFTVHSGQPSGGEDLCHFIEACSQGYITNDETQTVASQYRKSIIKSNNDASHNALTQLNKCIDNHKLGGIGLKLINHNVTESTTCIAQSAVWRGNQALAKITNIDSERCNDFNILFNDLAANCMINKYDSNRFAQIMLYSIAGIAGLVLAVGLGITIKKIMNHKHKNNKQHQTEPSAHV